MPTNLETSWRASLFVTPMSSASPAFQVSGWIYVLPNCATKSTYVALDMHGLLLWTCLTQTIFCCVVHMWNTKSCWQLTVCLDIFWMSERAAVEEMVLLLIFVGEYVVLHLVAHRGTASAMGDSMLSIFICLFLFRCKRDWLPSWWGSTSKRWGSTSGRWQHTSNQQQLNSWRRHARRHHCRGLWSWRISRYSPDRRQSWERWRNW